MAYSEISEYYDVLYIGEESSVQGELDEIEELCDGDVWQGHHGWS